MKKYLSLSISFCVLIINHAASAAENCTYSLYQLSSGVRVDREREGSSGPNGAVAEQWCADKGMRLPTLDELKEMYAKRQEICRYYYDNPKSCFNTEFEDAGGWPYWSERATHNPDGRDFGWRIIFGAGSEDYVPSPDNKLVRKFGNQGEAQQVEFWVSSGRGGYVRCVCDM